MLKNQDNKYSIKRQKDKRLLKILKPILQKLIGFIDDQNKIDNQMIDIDGTKNKSNEHIITYWLFQLH